MSRFRFMNTWIDNLTMEQALERIGRLARGDKPSYVVTPNVDHIVRIEKDELFRKIYEGADLILTDGQPLIWISKLYGKPIREKISGSDLFPRLCEYAAEKGLKMFFLGAADGVAARAAANLRKKYSSLQVTGVYSPPFGFEKDEEEIGRIIRMVHEAKPDILILGLGTPKQEKFIWEQKERLGVPVSLGLGASLDFEAGNVQRAPKWMSDHGFEWLYRLWKEPKRLFRRYIIEDTRIGLLALKYWKDRK